MSRSDLSQISPGGRTACPDFRTGVRVLVLWHAAVEVRELTSMGMMSWLTDSSVSKRVRKDSEGDLCLLRFRNAKVDEDLDARQTIVSPLRPSSPPHGEYLFGIYIVNSLPLPGYNLRLDLDSMNVKLQQNVGYKTTFERKGKFMSHGSLRDHPVEAGREKPMVIEPGSATFKMLRERLNAFSACLQVNKPFGKTKKLVNVCISASSLLATSFALANLAMIAPASAC
ncbi:hypothetical protein ARMGADRAFT_1027397 [Armillaria gallica]|uniref:Uncharacterized protein n=1 Tax=Armillaria gallica TaxID=47427 RepID=A0A2H3DQD9_ARMGA|nr:hypothetical protein ARMGADRAFT_1027397 [Armillaria gallica]